MNLGLFYVDEKGTLRKSPKSKYNDEDYRTEKDAYTIPENTKIIDDNCFSSCDNLTITLVNSLEKIGLAGLAGCKDIYCSTAIFKNLLCNTSVFGSYDIVHINGTNCYLYNFPNKDLVFKTKEELVNEFITEDDDDYSWSELVAYSRQAGGHFHEIFLEDFDNDVVGTILDSIDSEAVEGYSGETHLL